MRRRGRWCVVALRVVAAGLAGIAAGMISMGLGGYLAAAEVPGLTEAAAPAEVPVRVDAAADRQAARLGELVRYTISVTNPQRLDVTLPRYDETLGPFEIAASGQQRHGERTDRWFDLVSYEAGEPTIPPPVVRYRTPDAAEHEASGPAVKVEIVSELPPDWQSADIRAIKPPIRRSSWLWVAALAALIAGVAWWRRRRTAEHAPPAPPRQPHEIALEQLDRLKQERLAEQGRVEECFVRLSDIVRRYLEARFGVRAPEMTTEEFLTATSRSVVLSGPYQQLLRSFLERCDLVKFARYRPSGVEIEDAFDAARRFIEETKPAPEPCMVPR